METDGKRFSLYYFSGSGNTLFLARRLAEALRAEGAEAVLFPVAPLPEEGRSCGFGGIPVFLYPVYAFDAPSPVLRFLRQFPPAPQDTFASLVVSPCDPHPVNGAAGERARHILEKRGYRILREDQVVMPSNFLVPYPESLQGFLFRTVEAGLPRIASALVRERPNSPGSPFPGRVMRGLSKIEHLGDNLFGRDLRSGEACNGCGRCAAGCPEGNITLKDGNPRFGWHCVICMKCIYSCPEQAIHPRLYRFAVLKGGYRPRPETAEGVYGSVSKDIPPRFLAYREQLLAVGGRQDGT